MIGRPKIRLTDNEIKTANECIKFIKLLLQNSHGKTKAYCYDNPIGYPYYTFR